MSGILHWLWGHLWGNACDVPLCFAHADVHWRAESGGCRALCALHWRWVEARTSWHPTNRRKEKP